ncbi:MAG: hypothetical protein ACK4TO_09345 [Candidatus Nitrosotenuis sp.]
MSDPLCNYKLEVEKRINQLKDLPEYNITGEALVKRMRYRSKIIGADTVSEKDLHKEMRLDVRKILSRYSTRQPRANYGKLSTEFD